MNVLTIKEAIILVLLFKLYLDRTFAQPVQSHSPTAANSEDIN